MKEENCIVLDFLPFGYADRRRSEPIVQAVGCDHFSLLEIIIKEDANIKQEDELNIGGKEKEKIKFIKGSIRYADLTNMSKYILPEVVEKIVKKNEKKFIEFFNKAKTITPRMHQFQLLPGIGKKHVIDIIKQRSNKPFESFYDISKRVKSFSDPMKIIVKRILKEIENNEKYYLFVSKPPRNK